MGRITTRILREQLRNIVLDYYLRPTAVDINVLGHGG